VNALHPNAHIQGGTGNDTIIIRANRVQVMGGPGNDRIESWAAGASHIEGNAGKDTLVSHRGRTTINSQDGSPGDTVICDRGSKAMVFIDAGDTVRGSCTVAHRR
jgi:Ca2+-binding RTX toxin-like protein